MRSVTIAALMAVATSAAGTDKAPGSSLGLPLAAPDYENTGGWLLERCEARDGVSLWVNQICHYGACTF
jgi:hypothetical protein